MANFETAVMLPVIFTIGYYGYLIWLVKQEMFEAHGFLKSFFLIINFWLLLVPIALAIEIVDFNTGSAEMIGILSAMYTGMIYMNYFLTFYFVIFLVISFIRSINENLSKNAKQ